MKHYNLYIDYYSDKTYEFNIANHKLMWFLKIIGDCGDCEEYGIDGKEYVDVYLEYGSGIGIKNLVNLIAEMI